MAQVEERLGYKPRFGALDGAFDAWYIYDYFHVPDQPGFAAIPFAERGGLKNRQFTPEGFPICAAALPMPLPYTFQSQDGLVPHPTQRFACPLWFPTPTGQTCPIQHENFGKQGCTTTLAASPGSRLHYTLDRESAAYKKSTPNARWSNASSAKQSPCGSNGSISATGWRLPTGTP